LGVVALGDDPLEASGPGLKFLGFAVVLVALGDGGEDVGM